jgi:hypothetical protein
LCAAGLALFTTAGWFLHRHLLARAVK